MSDLIWTGSLNDRFAIRGEVGLYDTTLRDGEQTVGVVLSPEEKLEIARLLDGLGIERIEAGFPRVSEDDRRAVELIAGAGLSAEVWGFSRAVPADLELLVELALPFSLVWAGKGIKTFTATSDRPVVEGEPVLFEIWVCADGYWADHTKNLVVGELKPDYAELETMLMDVYDGALDRIRPGAPMAELDRWVRERLHEAGYAGQPTHPICHGVGARAHEPPYAHQAGGGEIAAGMVLAIEPGCYWEGGGGLRVEDNFLVTATGL